MAKVRPLVLIPLVLFGGLAATFMWGMLRENPSDMPSTFVGREAPGLPAEALAGFPQATDGMLRSGDVTLVNFWASWCPPCRAEHPKLKELAAEGIPIIGVNFGDKTENAQDYLKDEGNPFVGIGFDPRNRTAVNWGVTAPPETFIVGGDGTVLFKFVGPLVGSDYEQRFLPALNEALGR